MSSNFDWRAEDDAHWKEYLSGDPNDEQPPQNRKRPTWLIVLVAAVIVIGVGTVAFLRVRRYVENTAASVEEDVLSSHALVKMAAQEDDLELLAPLLSGRDPTWTQDQLSLLDANLLLDRQPFNLTWRPEETADDIAVTLSPDLQSAEIEYVETYGYGQDGQEDVIQLTQTAVYRLSETRWLLSPPDEEFWGTWITSKGSYITLTYPERDEAIGSRLASDLEATLAGACAGLELGCSDPWPLDVLLDTRGGALLAIDSLEVRSEDGQIVLPTPTLFGKPANDASYRAIYRGYAAYLLSQLVARYAGWECCDQAAFFEAMVQVQLNQLDFQSWRLTAADYRQVLRRQVDLGSVESFWEDELTSADIEAHPDGWMLYSFLEFLFGQESSLQVIDLQRALAETDSFNQWLAAAGISGNLNLVETEWGRLVQERVLETQQPPEAWPEEDVALVCNDGQSGMTNVYRYDVGGDSWSMALADRDFVVMNGLPGNQGLILTEQFLDVDQLRTTIWRDGQETVLTFGDSFYYSGQRSDPSGRYLLINMFQQRTAEGDFLTSMHLADLENCTQDGCPLLPIDGEPVWSPDGSRTLWSLPDFPDTVEGTAILYMGDGLLQDGEAVGTGFNAMWLDNSTYAYLNEPVNTALMAAAVGEQSPEQVVDRSGLAALIDDVEADDLQIYEAAVDPVAPELVFILVANRLELIDYLFAYDWQTGMLELVLTVEDSFGGLTFESFSPDHQWVALRSLGSSAPASSSNSGEIYLYNIERQEAELYDVRDNVFVPSEKWSNDGKWLLFWWREFLMLSNPENDYNYLVRHGFRDCTTAAWIK